MLKIKTFLFKKKKRAEELRQTAKWNLYPYITDYFHFNFKIEDELWD